MGRVLNFRPKFRGVLKLKPNFRGPGVREKYLTFSAIHANFLLKHHLKGYSVVKNFPLWLNGIRK